ncbi:dermonecrotic toxin domain-containing protein [Pseudomonas sp. PB3P13]
MTDHPPNDGENQPLVEKNHLVSQISHSPLLSEVAAPLLRRMLKAHYGELDIDPDKVMVGSPQWSISDGQVVSLPTRYESLTHALVRHSLFGTRADYLEGEHFLTREPHADNPVQLSVGIEDIANTLNDAAALLFVELQERQLHLWNQKKHGVTRWQNFSDSLAKAVKVKQVKGWDADECAMAREVAIAPGRATRKPLNTDFSEIQACLIDIDSVEKNLPRHLLIAGYLVIKGKCRGRQLIVMYTIDRGYESFGSLEQLGKTLPERLDPGTQASLEWRLFEPDGNVFDHMTWALISAQIDSIGSLGDGVDAPEPAERESGSDSFEQARYKQLDAAIPDWLRDASPKDIDDYRHYITGLGHLYGDPAHRIARAEIPSISQFAHKAMCDAITADEQATGAASLPWDQLRIRVTNSFTVDSFTLPNPLDEYTETLGEFALANEEPYLANLSFKNAVQLPAWLTPAYLTRIAAAVDVGSAYPALIKKTLIDDPVTSARQARFYREQLRWLLPLKALEGKIRHEAGIDERGYQYICRWLEPAAEAVDPIQIYPLAMTPQHRLIKSSDTVTNMFIISPRNEHSGPCLLYRPMQDQPLLQFPSRQNLLYALHQPGDLRDSVLAWLPDKTLSFEYAQFVFPVGLPSPWAITEQLVNPLRRADQFGRVSLASDAITGDVLTRLFSSNAKALVALADRQSQSNSERRWTLLKDSSWALFGAVTNFLSGAVGSAVWAWQIIEQIQQTLEAHERGDTFVQWKSESDILLAMGILLSHHAVMRRNALSGKPRRAKEPLAEIVEPPLATTVALDVNALVGALPSTHQSLVETGGAVPRLTPEKLATYLDALAVTPPELDTDEGGPSDQTPRYLHRVGQQRYAKVGQRWFNVEVDEDDQVRIVDPGNLQKNGPFLASDQDGRWVLDLRLRLKGGGPKNRLKALKAAKELRKQELKQQLDKFQHKKVGEDDEEGIEQLKNNEVIKAQTELGNVQEDEDEDNYRRLSIVYLEKVEAMTEAYQNALEQLREWHSLGGGPSYLYDSLRMHTELQKHISIWFALKKYDYSKAISVLRSTPERGELSRTDFLKHVQQVTDLSQAMVEKLHISAAGLEAMRALGRPGIEKAASLRKLMPSFTEWEVKANEIGVAQELCMEDQTSEHTTQARDDVGHLVIRGADAAQRISKILKRTTEEPAQDQIEELSQLIETLADVDQQFKDLPETYPGLLKQARIDRLRELLDEFSLNAQTLRSSLLDEYQPLQSSASAGPSKSNAPRPAAKVRKTRPRQPSGGQATPTLDEALDSITLTDRPRPSPVLDDRDIISNGLTLSQDADAFIARTLKDAYRPSRIPADMQDIFDQQATRLEHSAASVDQVLARSREFPVASLGTELRTAAARMRESGKSVRASLYKLRKPTQSTLRWMHENDQIEIRRDKGRIRTKQLGDYFQEYRILDKSRDNEELWVAHFHYEHLKTPAQSPTTAHLKVSDNYLKTLLEDQRKALTAVEPVDGVLRKINDWDLRKLFLDLEPQEDI